MGFGFGASCNCCGGGPTHNCDGCDIPEDGLSVDFTATASDGTVCHYILPLAYDTRPLRIVLGGGGGTSGTTTGGFWYTEPFCVPIGFGTPGTVMRRFFMFCRSGDLVFGFAYTGSGPLVPGATCVGCGSEAYYSESGGEMVAGQPFATSYASSATINSCDPLDAEGVAGFNPFMVAVVTS